MPSDYPLPADALTTNDEWRCPCGRANIADFCDHCGKFWRNGTRIPKGTRSKEFRGGIPRAGGLAPEPPEGFTGQEGR